MSRNPASGRTLPLQHWRLDSIPVQLYPYVLMLHVLGATIWTGGHLVLTCCVLPAALRRGSPEMLLEFEGRFEKLGMPALLIQIATGFWLASLRLPDLASWFRFELLDARLACIKVVLLLATAALAANARLRLIPRLTADSLPVLAWHIGAVTVFSVAFVVVGVSFRTGGMF
jgi:putative copper export protein